MDSVRKRVWTLGSTHFISLMRHMVELKYPYCMRRNPSGCVNFVSLKRFELIDFRRFVTNIGTVLSCLFSSKLFESA